MQPIYTQTVGAGGAATITFNNIPQTFTDLRLDISARSTNSGADNLRLKINNDSSTLYSQTALYGNGANAVSERLSSGSNVFILDYSPGGLTNALSTANTFSNFSAYISNYVGSNFKSVISDIATENNSPTDFIRVTIGAGLYRGTSAITRLDVFPFANFAQYSTFTLYGITKG